MIARPTVFILGAGASAAYKFPAGLELTKRICENVWNGNYLQGIAQEVSPHWEADARKLADELARATISIDTWLSYRTDQERNIGKYLIAKAIIEHENQANFREAFVANSDWYAWLWQALLPSRSKKLAGLRENTDVTFITFNYDRSLEQALLVKAHNTFGEPIDRCGEVLAQFPVIHVHGQLGSLPGQAQWNGHLKGMPEREYEPKCELKATFAYARCIKVMGEDDGEKGEYAGARNALSQAERIHFLGFGYHDENLRRLRIKELKPKATIYGTYMGIGQSQREVLESNNNEFGWAINMKHGYQGVLEYFLNMV